MLPKYVNTFGFQCTENLLFCFFGMPGIIDLSMFYMYSTCFLSAHIHENCTAGEFQCSDKSCIPTFDLCDGGDNCPLGEDENQTCSTFSNCKQDFAFLAVFWCLHTSGAKNK